MAQVISNVKIDYVDIKCKKCKTLVQKRHRPLVKPEELKNTVCIQCGGGRK